MKRILYISIVLAHSIICFGQSHNENYLIKYIEQEVSKIELEGFSDKDSLLLRIWQSDFQVLELRLAKTNIASGKLVNYVTKYNRREKPIKVLKETIDLRPNNVSELLNELINNGVHTIKDSNEIDGYPDGLDGKTTTIEVYSNNKYRITSYWEIENDYYIDSDNSEIKKVRSILKLANKEVSWWPLFKNFRDNLKPGAYRYGGINMTVMK